MVTITARASPPLARTPLDPHANSPLVFQTIHSTQSEFQNRARSSTSDRRGRRSGPAHQIGITGHTDGIPEEIPRRPVDRPRRRSRRHCRTRASRHNSARASSGRTTGPPARSMPLASGARRNPRSPEFGVLPKNTPLQPRPCARRTGTSGVVGEASPRFTVRPPATRGRSGGRSSCSRRCRPGARKAGSK